MDEVNPSFESREARQWLYQDTLTRLLELGPHTLSEVELISMVLWHGHRGRAHELAAELLQQFGSLRQLLTAERGLVHEAGLNRRHYATLQAALELTRRHYQELLTTGPALGDPRATREFLRMRLRDLPHEVFAIVYLDNRFRMIGFEELFRGTIDGASVYPREVVKRVLAKNAAAVILSHNHPSGLAEPSTMDEIITQRLKQALELVDVRVLDHFIVGDGVCESFAERGLL